ncbi:hypothetical protein TNCV_169271 [Trichonephila clavipes]|nr:hypothetical protein TNCV_169271 [Trichonephila clavipes]
MFVTPKKEGDMGQIHFSSPEDCHIGGYYQGHCAFRRDSSLKLQTDESLFGVRSGLYDGWSRRSQPRVAIWFCVAVAEYGFALFSKSRMLDLRCPGYFFPNPSA